MPGVTVVNTGLTIGSYDGISLGSAGSVINSGTVLATVSSAHVGDFHGGVRLSEGGYVHNTGLISSLEFGVVSVYQSARIVNAGTISGTGGSFSVAVAAGDTNPTYVSTGVWLTKGGTVSNASTGVISGIYGVRLVDAGSVDNAGTIAATDFGVFATTAATVQNSGLIEASARHFMSPSGVSLGGAGVELQAQGVVENEAGGSIIGYNAVVTGYSVSSSINNQGTLIGEGTYSAIFFGGSGSIYNSGLVQASGAAAIYLAAGANINNHGTLTGGYGISTAAKESFAVTVNNSGHITATSSNADAIYLAAGGQVTNQAGGTIAGYDAGVYIKGAAASLINAGTIIGFGSAATSGAHEAGLNLEQSPNVFVSNSGSGLISGHGDGIVLGNAAATVLNSGTISGADNGLAVTRGSLTGQSTVINSGTLAGGGSASGFYVTGTGPATTLGTFENRGLVTGGVAGIYEYGIGATVLNSGTIQSTGFGTPLIGTGVDIIGAGTVVNGGSNDTTALISGPGSGVYIGKGFFHTLTGNSEIVNYGTIGAKAELLNGGTLLNGTQADQSAFIDGVTIGGSQFVNGVQTPPSPTRFQNFGTVQVGTVAFNAVYVGTGVAINGSATDRTALIAGSKGFAFDQYYGTALNYAVISGGSAEGAYLGEGAITNFAGGIIESSAKALQLGGPVSFTNLGTVIGGGIALGTGPYGNNTIFNVGTIASTLGNSGTAVAFGNNNDRLIDEAGGVFIGTVSGGKGTNALELASSAVKGTVSGVGTEFVSFQSIVIDAGASWLVEGDSGGLASGQAISGFAAGDTIILDGFTATSESYVSGSGIVLAAGAGRETLDLLGVTAVHMQTVAAGTELTICYLAGTRVLTRSGECLVEELRPGDIVLTRFKGFQPVKWVGRQSYSSRFLSADRLPVRIARGALGPNMPAEALYVSPGHAVLVGEVFVLARNLVNGVTVTQEHAAETIAYYAIEFETHDCVLANGQWAESFADAPGLRAQFHNAAEFQLLFPDHITPDELRLCAPRPEAGPELEAALMPVISALAITPGGLRGYVERVDNSQVVGWAWDEAQPDFPVLVEICLGDMVLGTALACHYRGDLAAARLGRGHCMFSFSVADHIGTGEEAIIVRRACDGAILPRTDACREAA